MYRGSGEYEPKRRTKVFITTYAVGGTGLDALKVANYCVFTLAFPRTTELDRIKAAPYLMRYGVQCNANGTKQATERLDVKGEGLVLPIDCQASHVG
ncbi:uncharacterized protein GLRG_02058 [Colletotrichum graminicola M1.001]|uniref:Uncharacterized protein n=1 Tax=Colletotrichum graminicola (strain M1.001 / M2 / FGSC 10212) TaxID=645133 RepID=E3Q8L6_COLGM|nr:uncharacterized protein GLRG_02058 [Colletotrichum graminicola M1.001]EFQ26887.1 hypothetical protein GLRG_02058 [Colletotrichum graminicola M1.001]